MRDHEILLGLRNNEPLAGRWFTPGGRLLKNEPWQQGLERIVQAELGLNVSAVAEHMSTHYLNLPHVWYAKDDIDVAIDQRHDAIRWFDLEEVSQSRGHHKYMNHYAGWVLEGLR